MARFLRAMLWPLAILAAGLWIASTEVIETHGTVAPTVQASALDDPKLYRTLEAITGLSRDVQHPARLVPVDAPGIAFRFRMDPRIRRGYRLARDRDGPSNPYSGTWTDVDLAIGEGPYFTVLSRVRGGTSTEVDKKSMNLRLFSSQQFTDEVRLRRFFLTNLYADPLGFEAYTCYALLERLGLFPAYRQFAVVWINDEPEGLFLLIERPEDAIRRTQPDVVSVLRRRRDDFELKYQQPDHDARASIAELQRIHALEDDEQQLRAYDELVDLDQYLRWRGFNSLVQNIDSLDELYWYERRAPGEARGRLGLMAWDYDDIQDERKADDPHLHRDPLFWAAEGPLDRQILDNPLIYARYRRVLCALRTEQPTETGLTEAVATTRELLDGIDQGFGDSVGRRLREQRAEALAEFQRRLLERRRVLLGGAGC